MPLNKEDILKKSRQENKDQDLFKKEVSRIAGNISTITATIIATIFFVLQTFLGIGMVYGLYAVVFSILASGYTVNALYMKSVRCCISAIICIIATLILSIAHIAELIAASTIL